MCLKELRILEYILILYKFGMRMSTPRLYYNENLVDDRMIVANGTVDMSIYPYKMYELLQVL